jgi:hypothetical protein
MSAVTSVDWYQGHSPLHNVTGYSEDIAEVPVKIDMHGELIDVKGYKSQLAKDTSYTQKSASYLDPHFF